MNTSKHKNEAPEVFVPSYSISLLYQKGNNMALRVFISDAKNEQDAIEEATDLYNWTMRKYELVKFVAAKLEQKQYLD